MISITSRLLLFLSMRRVSIRDLWYKRNERSPSWPNTAPRERAAGARRNPDVHSADKSCSQWKITWAGWSVSWILQKLLEHTWWGRVQRTARVQLAWNTRTGVQCRYWARTGVYFVIVAARNASFCRGFFQSLQVVECFVFHSDVYR